MEEVDKCIESGRDSVDKRSNFQRYRVEILLAIATSLGNFTLGVQISWVTHAMRILTSIKDAPFHITHRQASFLVSCNPCGAVFGAILSFFLVHYWSRSKSLVVAAIPDTMAFVLYYFYPNYYAYCVGQFLTGIGVAIVCGVTIMYAVEIASPELRGLMGVLMIIASNTGTFTINCLVPLVDFNLLTVCIISVPVCQFIACSFLPESPYLLLKKDKVDEAKKVLQRLRNTKNVEREFKEMLVYTTTQFSEKITCRKFFGDRTYRRVFGYIGILILCQHLTGYIALYAFSQIIYSTGASLISPELCGIINSVCGVLFPFITGFFIHKFDRTVQFMISGVIVSGSLFALGMFYYLRHINYPYIDNWAFVPLASMLIYQFGFEMSYGPLVVLYMNEILPTNIRPIGGCLASIGLNLMAVLMISSYVPLQEWIGEHTTLWGYGICTIISSIIIRFYFPETSGKSFAQIHKKI